MGAGAKRNVAVRRRHSERSGGGSVVQTGRAACAERGTKTEREANCWRTREGPWPSFIKDRVRVPVKGRYRYTAAALVSILYLFMPCPPSPLVLSRPQARPHHLTSIIFMCSTPSPQKCSHITLHDCSFYSN